MDADTLKTLQAPIKARLREQPASGAITLHAEGDLNFRGTLGVAKDAAVGFTAVRLHVDLDTGASPEQIDTLLELTERYCVIFQTLNKPPTLAVSRSVHAS